EWKEWVEKQRASVIQAASVVEKLKMPLALENHKDWTSDELAKMMKQISSEYMGVCLDTGNNMALLEDPMQVIETITRDPLKVSCLLTKYWATFPDRSGYALVKFLQLVRSEPKRNVPHLSGLDRPAQLKAEEDNV